MKDLLISVTHFFRDAEAFEALEQRVIPRLFDNKGPDDQVRVWVPGCATGEEAYSIAMLLAEHVDGRLDAPAIQVFATDLDERGDRHCARGLLHRCRRRRRLRGAAGAVLPSGEAPATASGASCARLVLFAHHNVIKDPPFSHLDLISCRNLLIYLNRTAQERSSRRSTSRCVRAATCSSAHRSRRRAPNDLFVAVDRKTASLRERAMVTTRLRRARGAHGHRCRRTLLRTPEPRPSSASRRSTRTTGCSSSTRRRRSSSPRTTRSCTSRARRRGFCSARPASRRATCSS